MLSLREMCSSAKLILVSYPTCGELERHPLLSLTLRVRSWQSNLQENTSSSSFLHIIELRVIVSKLRGLTHSCRLASSQRTWRPVCYYLNSERESVDKAYIVRQNQRRIEKQLTREAEEGTGLSCPYRELTVRDPAHEHPSPRTSKPYWFGKKQFLAMLQSTRPPDSWSLAQLSLRELDTVAPVDDLSGRWDQSRCLPFTRTNVIAFPLRREPNSKENNIDVI